MKKNLGRDSDSRLLWQDELNPRVLCAFGNVLYAFDAIFTKFFTRHQSYIFLRDKYLDSYMGEKDGRPCYTGPGRAKVMKITSQDKNSDPLGMG